MATIIDRWLDQQRRNRVGAQAAAMPADEPPATRLDRAESMVSASDAFMEDRTQEANARGILTRQALGEVRDMGFMPAPGGGIVQYPGMEGPPPPPPTDPMAGMARASRMAAPTPEEWQGYDAATNRSADLMGIRSSRRDADPAARESFLRMQGGNLAVAPPVRAAARDELTDMRDDWRMVTRDRQELARIAAMPPEIPKFTVLGNKALVPKGMVDQFELVGGDQQNLPPPLSEGQMQYDSKGNLIASNKPQGVGIGSLSDKDLGTMIGTAVAMGVPAEDAFMTSLRAEWARRNNAPAQAAAPAPAEQPVPAAELAPAEQPVPAAEPAPDPEPPQGAGERMPTRRRYVPPSRR